MSAILFLCLFAGQAGLIALSPVLVEVASNLGVSTAAAGQLRTISGLAAGLTALASPRLGAAPAPPQLLVGGSILLAAGSLASAAAPNFAVLALAQLPVGVAVAVLVTAGTLAVAEWVPAEQRAPASSPGPSSATRLRGSSACRSPDSSAAPAGATHGSGCRWSERWSPPAPLRHGPALSACGAARGGLLAALSDRDVNRWALGETLANSAWIGSLVYSGALFTESYGTSTVRTGVVLALAAVAFAAGNLTSRRHADGDLRQRLVALALAMAVIVPLFGIVRPSSAVSAGLFAVAAFLGGARTLLGNAFGLQAAPERRVAVWRRGRPRTSSATSSAPP